MSKKVIKKIEIGDKVWYKGEFVDSKRKRFKGIITGFDWCGWPIIKLNRFYYNTPNEYSNEWVSR